MLELSSTHKNKIILSDYNYENDIENRMIISNFSTFELEVLEEILYSSLKIPFEELEEILDTSKEEILPVIEKLSKTDLLTYDEKHINVDKKARKYFEFLILKFNDTFKPNLEFLQGLLSKVPIHILPLWYNIPRSSNNIFQSIVDKYLITPTIYYRHINEVKSTNPLLEKIIKDLYNSDELKIKTSTIKEKYELSDKESYELILHLEFNLICCLSYNEENGRWTEVITPFHEWKEYLMHLKKTTATPIEDTKEIEVLTHEPFAFMHDVSSCLTICEKSSLNFKNNQLTEEAFKELKSISKIKTSDDSILMNHFNTMIQKLLQLKFLILEDAELKTSFQALEWLGTNLEIRALHFLRHPLNSHQTFDIDANIVTDRAKREAEKSVERVLNLGWVFFDDFINGAIAVLNEEHKIQLLSSGKKWNYNFPEYSSDEKEFIKGTVFESLYQAGIVNIGTLKGKPCFCVTSFGRKIFAE
ncbi:MAG TPA: hypothetical protein P5048_04955 [Chlamydiales bacterium]|nr:hypothetical protein [Chlamydiales bacterium]